MTSLRFQLPAALAIILLAATGATAQQPFRSTVTVANNGGAIDTLRWGIESGATYGIDAPLGEFEWPPFPVTEVFEVRFVNVPGHSELGEGVKLDLRAARDMNQSDTFNIRLQAGTGGYPLTVSWPSALSSNARRLRFVTLLDDTDMLTATSATITNPGIQQAMIIREGDAVASVDDADVTLAPAATLEEITPNPARTGHAISIAYSLARHSGITLKLHDALGRLRITTADVAQGPGRHELTLSTAELEPGSYYLTLTAGPTRATRHLVVVE